MKHLLVLTFLFTTILVSSQIKNPDGQLTKELVKIEGKLYRVWRTEGGTKYIYNKANDNGNFYPLWIGEATEKKVDGEQVRKSKSGEYFILAISPKTKQPYKEYIKIQTKKIK